MESSKDRYLKETLLKTKSFPQIKIRKHLPTNLLKSAAARLLNNEFFFYLLNHRYIKAYHTPNKKMRDTHQRIVHDLNINGIAFAKFSDFFSEDFYVILSDVFNKFQHEFQKNNSGRRKGKAEYLDTIYKAHSFTLDDPVSDYLGATPFYEIASAYMEMIPRFIGSSFWHTRKMQSTNRKYSQLWHRDYNDRLILKIFLYLSDVGPKEGCFEYITNTHNKGKHRLQYDKIGKDGYRSYPSIDSINEWVANLQVYNINENYLNHSSNPPLPWNNTTSIIRCLAPKGTMIFADTFGLHRGGFVEEGYRNIIMTTYSTNFNLHKPHFSVSKSYADHLNRERCLSFGITNFKGH